MHILLVSECEKKAIVKTNAILDSYAVRIGRRTWATPITMEALGELHSALRRTATRQTAVACWQNVANRRMKLLWVVGSRRKFAAHGAFPVSNSQTNAEMATVLPGWLRVVCLLSQVSARAHDLGKYSRHFQEKLRLPPGKMEADSVRHEWLSVCLLRALRKGKPWEDAWHTLFDEKKEWSSILPGRSGKNHQYGPANVDEALEYLVACHHKLFSDAWGQKNDLCGYRGTASAKRSHIRCDGDPDETYRVPYGPLPEAHSEHFNKLRDKLARLAIEQQGAESTPFWWACLLLARAALIFADHTISAQVYPNTPDSQDCAANTCPSPNGRRLNQPLAWHLENVACTAAATAWRIGWMLCGGNGDMPFDGLQEMALEAVLRPADDASRFAWQNRAAATLEIWRKANPDSPCLVFNLAGTGSGKTRMNLRAACLLSRQEQPRCTIALNLRSLTLQTGEALRADLGLQKSDLATIIGDDITKRLFEHARQTEIDVDEDSVAEEETVLCSGEAVLLPEWLEPFFRNERERVLLGTPVLVSTIDFLEAAGNPGRQGHHVKALLRLLTADLVLDEIDGYEPESLVAVLRLVQLSALFGRNVVCSSATLSRPVAEAVHAAWQSGRQLRQALDGDKTPLSGIALIDDHLPPEIIEDGETGKSFSQCYAKRLQNLTETLRQPPCPRRAFLQIVESNIAGFYAAVQMAVERLHSETVWTYCPDRRVSFGLVRMANINTAIDTAICLAKVLPQAYVACYHANDWRISRFHKEQRLDHLLTRKDGNRRLVEDEEIRRLVSQSPHSEVIFIVVATPVEEIGRDHDFDWAVIEPSSAQSIVQTAGRVNRHRLAVLGEACNIAVLQYNFKHCRNCENGNPDAAAFIRPGYEERQGGKRQASAYEQHDLSRLLPWQEEKLAITAALRFSTACRFGRQDDRAISKRVTRYFGTDEDDDLGLFIRLPIDAYRMSATPYEETPLRDKNDRHETWRIQIDEDGEHWSYERWDSDGKRMQFVENNREMTEEKAPPNAWLGLSPEEMAHLCEQSGITPEEGMQAELAIFGSPENTDWIYNLGFGIRRRKN